MSIKIARKREREKKKDLDDGRNADTFNNVTIHELQTPSTFS